MTAWQDGSTGQGQTIAIIDTGIDSDSPEFAGRIHPDSRSVAGNATFEAEDQHGTNVALIAAAALDGQGVVGIAFDASILALRADQPGSCNENSDDPLDGCSFRSRDVAAGVDQAVNSGARVVNISLGGGAITTTLSDAIRRAAAAGIVVIVSAGNDGDTTEPDLDPDQPDPFAQGVLAAGGGNVIIVGSVDENGRFSDFSNRAGDSAASFLSARGEAVCCIYEDGTLRITTDEAGNRFVTLFSGTSFSAPQVAGAVALLAQAFPNLSGTEIVEILLASARDAGAAGTDPIYGRGILDIGAAFAPSGTTSLGGTNTAVSPFDTTGVGSNAMGDAFAGASLETIITDAYDRAYTADLGAGLQQAAAEQRLLGAIGTGSRRVAGRNSDVAMAFSIENTPLSGGFGQLRLDPADAEAARILAARIAVRIAPETQIALGLSESADGLALQLQGQDRPAFLIASEGVGAHGFYMRGQNSFAVRQELGGWGVTAIAERAEVLPGLRSRVAERYRSPEDRRLASTLGLQADGHIGPIELALGFDWMREDSTILGARLHDLFGAGGADTIFFDGAFAWHPVQQWRLGGSVRYGLTRAENAGRVTAGSDFGSFAWSMDVSRNGFAGAQDTIGLRVSQPLRVESGGLALELPVAYDYATESAISGQRFLSLAPTGREMMGELVWSGPAGPGFASASLFYRRQPGHVESSPDDAGVAIRYSAAF